MCSFPNTFRQKTFIFFVPFPLTLHCLGPSEIRSVLQNGESPFVAAKTHDIGTSCMDTCHFLFICLGAQADLSLRWAQDKGYFMKLNESHIYKINIQNFQ